jgi:thymidine kinase
VGVVAELSFTRGVMNAGKSALALQTDFNLRMIGRRGLLLTRLDRGGDVITSRLGLSRPARSFGEDDDLFDVVRGDGPDFVVVDEAQFLSRTQVDQLARVVDELGVDVHAFGISTDFTSTLFPGSARLLELADRSEEIQVKALCWCGTTARMNARVVDGTLVMAGEQVMLGDVVGETRYVLLCRPHFVSADLGPLACQEEAASSTTSGERADSGTP